ncbi:MAG: 50S ribosomal protein L6 [Candidatus Methanolliviera sp. GoM_oil]|nr:MAG: 50S ribosomal protein L6 [Candidatus Methanolliviera sp. GoM_oil]
MRRELNIPGDVEITIDKDVIEVKGPKGTLKERLFYIGVEIFKEDNKVIVSTQKSKKEHRSIIGTFASHINNMIVGITSGFEYKLKVVYAHFPIQLELKDDKLVINNFLGEKKPRVANILGDAKVKIDKDTITVTGTAKEEVGQTAANMEQGTKIRRRDPRVFQDGIYLISRG